MRAVSRMTPTNKDCRAVMGTFALRVGFCFPDNRFINEICNANADASKRPTADIARAAAKPKAKIEVQTCPVPGAIHLPKL
jgi:hypothetical protein